MNETKRHELNQKRHEMLNNTIQKNAICKAKSKRKLTRFEQLSLTDEERRIMYDRRSSHYLLKKQRQTKSPYLSDRKLIKFLAFFSVSLEKKQDRSNELYIYNYNTSTKRVSKFGFVNLQKRGVYGMSNWATMNANKLFTEEKSDYTSDNAYYPTSSRFKNINSTTQSQSQIQTETKNTQKTETRSNISAYQPYVYRENKYRVLTREEALSEVAKTINASKSWFDFIGKHETMEWARQRIEQWTTEGMVERESL